MQTPTKEAGFTLVELLVSLSLLSLMAIYALNAFNINSQMRAIAKDIESRTEVTAVLRQFRDEIGTLTSVYRQDDTGFPALVFDGQSNQVSYVEMTGGTREVGGLYRVTWQLNDKQQLTVMRELLRKEGSATEPFVVLEGVTDLHFIYNNDQSVWKDQKVLPKSIYLL